MADYGASDTSTTALGTNQFPISEVYVPNGSLTALEGGPASTDSSSKRSAPVSSYVKDGGDVAQGSTTDAANVSTVIGQLKQIKTNTASVAVGSLPSLPAGTNVIGHVVVDSAGNVSVTSLPSLPSGTNVIGHVIVDSGTVTVNALPTGSNTIGGVELVDSAGTNKASISAGGAVKVDNSAVTQPVSAASLPLPTGAATSAKQPALGTAGSASGDVLTVQGITSMTALKVDGSAATQPVSGSVSVSNFPGTQPVSGTVSATQSGSWTTQPITGTSGGSTPSHTMSAASTNATSLKASTGMVYGLSISNTNASARYFKLYNKASVPTVGTDTPVLTLQIPGNATVIRAYPIGLALGTGIAWAATGGIADTDTTAIGANDLSIDLDYK